MATTNNNTNVNNNENKQPMQYHQFSYRGGYIYNPESDKLEEVVGRYICYDFEHETEHATVTLAGGKELNVGFDDKLYKNENDYRNGNGESLFSDTCHPKEWYISDLPQFTSSRFTIVVKRDGKPEVFDALKEIHQLARRKEKDKADYVTTDCEIPNDYYIDMNEYYRWNELVTLNADGSETRKGGECARLLPTPTQQELIDHVFAAIGEAEKAGVRFLYDQEDDVLFAANFADKRIDTRWDGDYADDDTEYTISTQKIISKLPRNYRIYYVNCDQEVVFFKEEQK